MNCTIYVESNTNNSDILIFMRILFLWRGIHTLAQEARNLNITETKSTKMKPKGRPTRARYTILLLLFIATAINYLDRTNIAVSASSIQDDLGLSSVTMGLIFSGFGWTYALMQIPGGWFLDRLGARIVYAFSLFTWSLATLATGFARSFADFIWITPCTRLL